MVPYNNTIGIGSCSNFSSFFLHILSKQKQWVKQEWEKQQKNENEEGKKLNFFHPKK